MKSRGGIAYKIALDGMVAELTGVSRRKVSQITSALYDVMRDQLAHTGELQVPTIGALRVYVLSVKRELYLTHGTFKAGVGTKKRHRVNTNIRVCFSKAPRLRSALKEKHMDKLGVDESSNQEELEKRAAHGCPKCSRKLEKHGSVVLCPVHGTEPFEAVHGSQEKGKSKVR